jgi:type IV pilus assembly protein PilA
MDEKNTWQVIITNQLADDQDREQVISRLASLFKTDSARAAQLITKPSTVIKDKVDETTAKKYHLAISKTGAHCEIVDTASQDEDLPDIFEPVVPESKEALEGLIRHPEPQQQKAHEPAMALVEKEVQNETETREKLSQFDNVDPSLFCPQCGSIRSAADSACIQCDYDPETRSNDHSGFGRIAIIALAALVVVLIAGYFGMPFYQQFAKKAAIQDGLQLAIDTRNHITQFILKTNFWPNQNIDANLPKNISNDIVASIEVTGNGAFTVTLREQVLGKADQTLIFKPNQLKGKLVWNCTGGSLDNEYRPEICRKQSM